MTRHVPNLLTTSRFFMAIAFFIVVGFHDPDAPSSALLDAATAVFLVGVATDLLDGYLARRLGHVSAFGRIADPFVDKIIVCGALVYFVGPLGTHTPWAAWMVVLIIARELLVTGMRSFSESHGVEFAATWSGKAKMFLQCVAITWTLVYLGHYLEDTPRWVWVGLVVSIWATTLFTGLSGLVYIKRGYQLLKMPVDEESPVD